MSGYIGNIPTPQATQTRDTFTATSGQTSFATSGYTPGFLDVFLNGVHLVNGTDYTASNGSDVVLTTGATTGDNLEVVSYSTFEVFGQTFTGNSTFTGNLTVDTNTLFVDAANNRVGVGTGSTVRGDLNIYRSAANFSTDQDSDYGSLFVQGGNGNTTGSLHGAISFGKGISSVGREFYKYGAIALVQTTADVDQNGLAFFVSPNADQTTPGTIAEAMRIDASGNLLVGTTSTTPAVSNDTDGIALQANGTVQFSANATTTAIINRKATDGAILQFRKDGTTVGSIGNRSGSSSECYIALTTVGTGAGLMGGGNGDALIPSTDSGAVSDATINLGGGTARFKNLYLSGGVYLGGTGSANLLDDYEEGTWTPTLISGGTISVIGGSQAVYTKVGRQVTVFAYFTLSSIPNNGASFSIGGLPFTSGSLVNNPYGAGSISYSGAAVTEDFGVLNTTSNTTLYFHLLSGSSTDVKNNTIVARGISQLILSKTYFTN